ncbi:hypothetical protein H257_16344 [Aphanomyces astaci]|uniref:Uncharacterized protein n=1 Tax=Aphanomyces astaci TaxID=112090 RepID=W4FL99_APHAT|nr:hypothetical protein H257_16344 [Aphanomyces astaci]ETV67483.1 hypothetical protein H257_16344 [Aphanomyces astaci]|eukprot:XP_009843042.1 hypothetical protein H257_16344 [Aphanomyces astaci]
MSVAYYPSSDFSMDHQFPSKQRFVALSMQRPTPPLQRHAMNVMPMHKKPVELGGACKQRSWRGTCRYKSGRCSNERTLKFNGEIHTMCEEHRIRHNNNQRRSDLKRRIKKSPELTSSTSLPYLSGAPVQPSSGCSSQKRPSLQKQLFAALDLSSGEAFLKPEAMDAINNLMSDDDQPDYEIRPPSCTMELTPQEVKILHSILDMDDESMG